MHIMINKSTPMLCICCSWMCNNLMGMQLLIFRKSIQCIYYYLLHITNLVWLYHNYLNQYCSLLLVNKQIIYLNSTDIHSNNYYCKISYLYITNLYIEQFGKFIPLVLYLLIPLYNKRELHNYFNPLLIHIKEIFLHINCINNYYFYMNNSVNYCILINLALDYCNSPKKVEHMKM